MVKVVRWHPGDRLREGSHIELSLGAGGGSAKEAATSVGVRGGLRDHLVISEACDHELLFVPMCQVARC